MYDAAAAGRVLTHLAGTTGAAAPAIEESIAPITTAVTRAARGPAAANLPGAAGDAARAVDAAALHAPAPAAVARSGPMQIRVLANEGDADGTNIMHALHERGVDSSIWDLRHLEHSPFGLTYRGQAVERPDMLISYHGAMVPDGGLDKMFAMEADGIPFVNGPQSIVNSRNKATSAVLFKEHGVQIPDTEIITDPSQVRDAVGKVNHGGTPTFFKDPVGTQGVGVARVTDPEEAVAFGELVAGKRDGDVLLVHSAPGADGTPARSALVPTAADAKAAIAHVQGDSGAPVHFRYGAGTSTSNADAILASGGRSAVITKSSEVVPAAELAATMDPANPLLAQRPVPLRDDGVLADRRLFFVGDELPAAMDRVQESADEFRTNLHNEDPTKAAKGVAVTPTQQQYENGLKAKNALELEIAGMDDMNGFIIEGNSGPGQKIKHVTGVAVDGKIADYAIAKVERLRAASAAGGAGEVAAS